MTEHDPAQGAGEGSSRSRKQLLLRLDPSVHAAIAKWASDDLRSVNAQIEVLLRRALTDSGRDPRPGPLPRRGRPPKDDQKDDQSERRS